MGYLDGHQRCTARFIPTNLYNLKKESTNRYNYTGSCCGNLVNITENTMKLIPSADNTLASVMKEVPLLNAYFAMGTNKLLLYYAKGSRVGEFQLGLQKA